MKRSRKIYISIPEDEKPELLRLKVERVSVDINRVNDKPVTALHEGEAKELHEQVKMMMDADVVFFMRGWQHSRSCLALFEIAYLYGKEVMFE